MLNVSWKERPGLRRSDSIKPISQQKEQSKFIELVKIKLTRQNLTKSFPEIKIQLKNREVFSW